MIKTATEPAQALLSAPFPLFLLGLIIGAIIVVLWMEGRGK